MRLRLFTRSVLALSLGTLLSSVGGARGVRADDPAPAPDAPDIDETRGYVGYAPGFVQDLEAAERKELGIVRKAGLYVMSVTTNSPADKSGIKVGDVVLKIKGTDMTDAEKVLPKDEDDQKKWREGKFRTVTSTVKPGEEVEMLLDRGGKEMTVKPIAIERDAMKRLNEADQEERDAIKVPDADGMGTPRAHSYSFEKLPDDQVRPDTVLSIRGLWEVAGDDDAEKEGKDNHVLKQSSDLGDDYALAVANDKGLSHQDSTASVRLRFMAGEKSVSGGIVVRARDRKNWYAVVADGVAKKLEVFVMKDMKRVVLASSDLGSPKLKSWHTLEVKTVGDTISATFDGTVKVEAKDTTIKQTGWFGLVTRGDAETEFDDWKMAPVAK